MANLMRQLQAIAMTAGSEKRQQDSRYNFNLRAGRSKIVPFYFCKRNSDGSIDNNEYFNLTAMQLAEKGIKGAGKVTNPVTTQGMKGMIISNLTPINAASNGGVVIQIRQDSCHT